MRDNYSAMTKKGRNHVHDLRGATRLAVEATKGVTDLVEQMHRRVSRGPALIPNPLAGPIGAISGLVFWQIRGVTGLVGAGIDLALAALAPLIRESAPGPQREALLAALNGVLGDYLAETDNPLAIEMRLRRDGRPLALERAALEEALPDAGRKVLLFVHGSSMGDLQWRRNGRDPDALARQLGYTPLFLHYNSGLHISTNGSQLAALLEALSAEWPQPLEELAFVGHSMGGLVARSACHAASAAGHRWRAALRTLVCLGAPHHGAPLERYGSWLHAALDASSYSAPFARLGRIRSAGVTDLRHGNVRDEDWQGRDRFEHRDDGRLPLPLPEGVRCFAAAATHAQVDGGRLPSDGLVPVDSALGRHPRPEHTLAFPPDHQWIALGMGHLDLLGRAEVYEVLARWLRG